MSRLVDLVDELCPDGVEVKRIEQFAKCYAGATPSTSKPEYWDGGIIPWMSSGEVNYGEVTYTEKAITKLGFDKSSTKMVPINSVVIALAGQGKTRGTVAITRIELCTNQSLCAIVPDDSVISEYLLWYLRSQYEKLREISAGDGTRGGLTLKMINAFEVPVPPLKIQQKIVSICETFNSLICNLELELELRYKQYNELAYRLLIDNNEAEKIKLKDICNIVKGKTAIQKATPGEYPLVVTATERKSCDTFQFNEPAVCIPLVSSRGHGVACLNHVYYQEGKFAVGNILCAVTPREKVLAKYLYYYFECTKDYTLVPLMKGGANVSMTIGDIEKVNVPIPELDEQRQIISKLEILDEYCNSILPAEIAARKQQFAYYRDVILDFKNLHRR